MLTLGDGQVGRKETCVPCFLHFNMYVYFLLLSARLCPLLLWGIKSCGEFSRCNVVSATVPLLLCTTFC